MSRKECHSFSPWDYLVGSALFVEMAACFSGIAPSPRSIHLTQKYTWACFWAFFVSLPYMVMLTLTAHGLDYYGSAIALEVSANPPTKFYFCKFNILSQNPCDFQWNLCHQEKLESLLDLLPTYIFLKKTGVPFLKGRTPLIFRKYCLTRMWWKESGKEVHFHCDLQRVVLASRVGTMSLFTACTKRGKREK